MRRFRQILGFYLLISLAVSLPQSIYFYKSSEMIDRSQWLYSPLLFSDLLFSYDLFVYTLIACLMFFSFRLFIEKNSYFEIVLLTLGYLLLQYANPLILHEPQPLTQIFLWALVLSGPFYKGDSFLKSNLIWFLGLYYLLAGLEKLPDPIWKNGQALSQILSNPLMTLPSTVNIHGLTTAGSLLWITTYIILFLN